MYMLIYITCFHSSKTRAGPPFCGMTGITIEDIAVDSVAVSWVVNNCNIQPTEYEVVWSEVGSEGQFGTSGRILSDNYTVDNLACCKNYTITVLLYNECGVGSNSSISSLTSKLIIYWLSDYVLIELE